MPDETLSGGLADDKIEEIQKKISDESSNQQKKQDEIFARINGNSTSKNTPNNAESDRKLTEKVVINPENLPAKKEIQIKNLRTLQGDVADAIKKQNTSVITIAVAEQKRKREKEPKSTENKSKTNNTLAIVLSIIFIILGLGTIFAFYFFQKTPASQEERRNKVQTIIGYDQIIAIPINSLSKEKLLEFFDKERRNESINRDEILYTALIEDLMEGQTRFISTEEFFALLEHSAPPALLRSFGKDFMFGFYKLEGNEPFLIIEIESFENAYNEMFKWEENINKDVGSIFSKRTIAITEKNDDTNSSFTGMATSSATTTENVTRIMNYDLDINSEFEDETYRNKDARVLKNINGETVLLYSFLDKNTLLLTTNGTVLLEMVDRLAEEKLVR